MYRGRRLDMSETVQHSSASGSTVWLVYEYTPRVISHALSHAMSYNDT